MSAASFDAALAFVLAHEGGFSDDPADPGGATNLGVTLATLQGWMGTHEVATVADVRGLTVAAVTPIYRARYWRAVSGDDLPAGVDLAVFDPAVNMGVGRAARFLQAVVWAERDGDIGPRTLAAVRSQPAADVINSLCDRRLTFYRGLPTFETFGRGWTTRVADCRAAALAMLAPGAGG